MENNIKMENLAAEEIVNFSPHWNEIYADGAFITTDPFVVRISFVNHLPQYPNTGAESVQISRKVDVVLSKEAFILLSQVINEINEKIRKEDA